ncbi:hypothetical protein BH11VER1_BH11VER1_06700 [soil metagenome]
MTMKENISRWRRLSPEEKLRRRWESIPLDVAQSMAFEGEPVAVARIRSIVSLLSPFRVDPQAGLTVSQSSALARIELPALLKPHKAS